MKHLEWVVAQCAVVVDLTLTNDVHSFIFDGDYSRHGTYNLVDLHMLEISQTIGLISDLHRIDNKKILKL